MYTKKEFVEEFYHLVRSRPGWSIIHLSSSEDFDEKYPESLGTFLIKKPMKIWMVYNPTKYPANVKKFYNNASPRIIGRTIVVDLINNKEEIERRARKEYEQSYRERLDWEEKLQSEYVFTKRKRYFESTGDGYCAHYSLETILKRIEEFDEEYEIDEELQKNIDIF